MKCPVCKNEINEDRQICPLCKFDDLHRTFINAEDAAEWMDNIVIPYRKRYLRDKTANAELTYSQLFQSQLSSIKSISKSCVSDYEYTLNEYGVILTQYNGVDEAEVLVPTQIEGKDVYRLEDNLFKNCKSIHKINLPETITEIGTEVFSNTKIKELNLPHSLKKIGAWSLSDTSIETLIIPENVAEIPAHLFGNFHKTIKTVIILGAKSIGSFALNCSTLSQVVFPDCLEKIELRALDSTKIKKIIFPQSLKIIEAGNIPYNSKIAFLNDSVRIEWFRMISSDRDKPCATFYCNQGSTAHIFARKYGLPCLPLSEFPKD